MSNVMDAFDHLNALSPTQLFERRSTLIGAAPNGDYRQLADEALQELVAIARVLRKKSSPAAKSPAARKGANLVPTLDSI